ncbi:MAG: hypothetical protein ACRDJN_17800, partial [Chloroflexota bacterium]
MPTDQRFAVGFEALQAQQAPRRGHAALEGLVPGLLGYLVGASRRRAEAGGPPRRRGGPRRSPAAGRGRARPRW